MSMVPFLTRAPISSDNWVLWALLHIQWITELHPRDCSPFFSQVGSWPKQGQCDSCQYLEFRFRD